VVTRFGFYTILVEKMRNALLQLDGLHHVTAITAEPGACRVFYGSVLGLRVDSRHPARLYIGDGELTPGGLLCFLSRPNAVRGRAGAGMVHRLIWRVGGAGALRFWERRLAAAGVTVRRRGEDRSSPIVFSDPEGLEHELAIDRSADEPLRARRVDVPRGCEIRGLEGVRTYTRVPVPTADLLCGRLGFNTRDVDWLSLQGPRRSASVRLDLPQRRGHGGAGTVHHVALTCSAADQPAWRQRVIGVGARVSPTFVRGAVRSTYFREPGGVLFEFASSGPGALLDNHVEDQSRDESFPDLRLPVAS
jgi:glyoxalase family protein